MGSNFPLCAAASRGPDAQKNPPLWNLNIDDVYVLHAIPHTFASAIRIGIIEPVAFTGVNEDVGAAHHSWLNVFGRLGKLLTTDVHI